MSNIGIIAIGRNEGERLGRCLRSVVGRGWAVAYVDSKSTDGSVDLAKSLGVEVLELDMSIPFSAARARNAGFEKLIENHPQTEFVQFVDGDCEVVDAWIERAKAELDRMPQAAVVCGRRRESQPRVSVYNRLADLEWDTPIGEAQSCGGDALMRVRAFRDAGGFDASVAAGEEPELCQRLRGAGWKIFRIDAEMTLHDSAILQLGQWWRRAIRSGYGAADVATRFGKQGLFAKQVRGARQWAIGFPILVIAVSVLAGIALGAKWGLACFGFMTLLLPAQMLRIALRARRKTDSLGDAMVFGALTMLSKWAFVLGEWRYRSDRRAGRNTRLIDYKSAASATGLLKEAV